MLEGKCGKVPCYNNVENWMKKLGLSAYAGEGQELDGSFFKGITFSDTFSASITDALSASSLYIS